MCKFLDSWLVQNVKLYTQSEEQFFLLEKFNPILKPQYKCCLCYKHFFFEQRKKCLCLVCFVQCYYMPDFSRRIRDLLLTWNLEVKEFQSSLWFFFPRSLSFLGGGKICSIDNLNKINIYSFSVLCTNINLFFLLVYKCTYKNTNCCPVLRLP